MTALSVPIVLMLAAAFLLGAALGWALRREKSTSKFARLAERRRLQLDEQQKKFERLRRQRRELRARVEEIHERYRTRLRQAAESGARSPPDDAELERLRTALADSIERRDALRRQLERLISRSRAVAAEATEGRLRIASLEESLAVWQRKLPPLMDKYREKSREAERLAALLGLPVDDTAVVEGDAAPAPSSANDTESLQRIRGIGPALERKLHDLGIYRLEQIAGFDSDDVARVGRQLGAFAGRIDRDGWVAQARAMVNE